MACNILKRGMEKFPMEVDLLRHSLDFYVSIKKMDGQFLLIQFSQYLLRYEIDARALFMEKITSFPPEKVRHLWDHFLEHENNFGELATIKELEELMITVYPHGKIPLCDSWRIF